jgi:hypothetical protein
MRRTLSNGGLRMSINSYNINENPPTSLPMKDMVHLTLYFNNNRFLPAVEMTIVLSQQGELMSHWRQSHHFRLNNTPILIIQ